MHDWQNKEILRVGADLYEHICEFFGDVGREKEGRPRNFDIKVSRPERGIPCIQKLINQALLEGAKEVTGSVFMNKEEELFVRISIWSKEAADE